MHLTDHNVVLRDWTDPVFSEEEQIWVYKDVLRSEKPGEALVYRWHNDNGIFMARALGDNPHGLNLYRAFTTTPDEPSRAFDYASYYEKDFRRIGRMGESQISPFKRFNAKMYEDLSNQGPFGGMLLPFDYNVYYNSLRDSHRRIREEVSCESPPVLSPQYCRSVFLPTHPTVQATMSQTFPVGGHQIDDRPIYHFLAHYDDVLGHFLLLAPVLTS
jgi:hypothetical protein